MQKLIPLSGWLAFIFGFAALFFYIVVPDQLTLIGSLLALSLANGLFVTLSSRDSIKKILKSRSALYGVNTFVLVAVFLGILIFVNLLSYRHKTRIDFTESRYFTLAPQTQKIVSNLPREITLTAFFQSDSPDKTAFVNRIDGYLGLTDKIKIKYVDPDKSPAITKQYGVTVYGTVVLESGKQETKIQNPTEENLTNGILKVIQDKQKVIYFLEGHGENDPEKSEVQGYSTARQSLEKDGFKVKKLLLLQTGEIPEEADVIVISGPDKPLLPKEQKILEAYLDRGGSILLLIDPQSQFKMKGLLDKWGIELGDDIIIDPMSKLFGGDFAAPVISQFTLHDITKDFALATIFPVLRSVSFKKVEGITGTELMQSGPNSWAESEFQAEKVQFDEGQDRKGPVPVAVIASREIDPDSKEKNKNETSEDKNIEDGEKASSPKSHLIVIGDSDFANNNYFNFSGNGDLFLNTVSWLAEEENLISIRPHERKDTPVQLTRAWGSAIFILGIIVFPSAVLLVGLGKWWRRRRL